jgi:hypothetical protein
MKGGREKRERERRLGVTVVRAEPRCGVVQDQAVT